MKMQPMQPIPCTKQPIGALVGAGSLCPGFFVIPQQQSPVTNNYSHIMRDGWWVDMKYLFIELYIKCDFSLVIHPL
jgi:hypothetical protein